MADMSMISGAVSSLKAAGDMAKALIGIRDATILNQKIIELQGVILSAQSSALAAQSDQFTLLERIRTLETQVASLEAWETEKKRYNLTELAPGRIAYLIKEEARGSQPIHCICANCYEDEKKAILQIMRDFHGIAHVKCPRCKTELVCSASDPKFPIKFD